MLRQWYGVIGGLPAVLGGYYEGRSTDSDVTFRATNATTDSDGMGSQSVSQSVYCLCHGTSRSVSERRGRDCSSMTRHRIASQPTRSAEQDPITTLWLHCRPPTLLYARSNAKTEHDCSHYKLRHCLSFCSVSPMAGDLEGTEETVPQKFEMGGRPVLTSLQYL